MIKKNISASAKETFSLGKKLGAACRGGEVFALMGDLGAGKTCLVQGLAKGLGVKGAVNSPTFVVMKIYPVSGNKRIKHFCHIDAYRLSSAKELKDLEALDYIKQADTVSAIEWGDKVKSVLPQGVRKIKIKLGAKENEREISF